MGDKRLEISAGIREFHSGDWTRAEEIFQKNSAHPVASSLWNEMLWRKNKTHREPLPDLLNALISDAAILEKYSSSDLDRLRGALAEALLYSQNHTLPLNEALEKTRANWDTDTQKIWTRFQEKFWTSWKRLDDAFQEPEPELFARNCLWLAREFQGSHFGGSAWLLTTLGAQHPAVAEDAKKFVGELEGKRFSTEFVISDVFDHGGTSIALNLTALVPTVGLTRKLYRTRPWVALLAGGPIHFASTKSLMLLSGYSGNIIPESFGGFAGELGSSYLQASAAIFLCNRLLWKPAKTLVPATEVATGSAAARLLRALPRGAWWTTKTSLKVSAFTLSGLLTQYLSHATGMKPMTPQGLPENLAWAFPKTWEIRREVAQGYRVRNDLRRAGNFPVKSVLHPTEAAYPEPARSLDQWLAPFAAHLDNDLHEMLFAELYQASLTGNFGLNVQRWLQKKIDAADWAGANATWELKKIPVRFDPQGNFCLLNSARFACEK